MMEDKDFEVEIKYKGFVSEACVRRKLNSHGCKHTREVTAKLNTIINRKLVQAIERANANGRVTVKGIDV